VAEVIAGFPAVDGAFNNAGIEGAGGAMVPLIDYPDEEFDRIIVVNLRGLWNCLKAELPALQANGGGSVVNTSSVMGWLGAAGKAAYSASKHGVVGLTRTAALAGSQPRHPCQRRTARRGRRPDADRTRLSRQSRLCGGGTERTSSGPHRASRGRGRSGGMAVAGQGQFRDRAVVGGRWRIFCVIDREADG